MYGNELNAKDVSLKAILSGIGLYGLSAAVYGDTGIVEIGGNMIPTIFPLFGAGAVASVASDLVTSKAIPMIPQEAKYKNGTSALIDFTAAGVAGTAALKLVLGIPNGHLLQAFMLSGIVNGAVEWAYYNVISSTQKGFLL